LRGHKIGTSFSIVSIPGLFATHFLRVQKRNHRVLRIPLLSRNRLGVSAEHHSTR
jgi:hypothetical protein